MNKLIAAIQLALGRGYEVKFRPSAHTVGMVEILVRTVTVKNQYNAMYMFDPSQSKDADMDLAECVITCCRQVEAMIEADR
jgi:hypothetical protein